MNVSNHGSVSVLLIGTNGTGKSTILREILWSAASGKKKKVIVLPSNPAETTFEDVPEISLDDIDKFKSAKYQWGAVRVQCFDEDDFIHVIKDARNCVFISDDFKFYLSKSVLKKDIMRAFIMRRHMRNDFYFAAHGFKQVPPMFFAYMDWFYIFRCRDNPKGHADKMLDANNLLDIITRVNNVSVSKKDPWYYEIIENK